MSSFLKISVLEFCQRNLYQGLLYLHPHQISHQCTFDASKTLAAFPNAKLDDCQRKFFNVIMGSLFFQGWHFFCAVKESASFWLFFLFQVVLSAGVLSLVFVGGVQMCHSARTSSQPHRLVPLANGMSQLALTLTLLMIAVILPMLAQLRY